MLMEKGEMFAIQDGKSNSNKTGFYAVSSENPNRFVELGFFLMLTNLFVFYSYTKNQCWVIFHGVTE